MTAGKCISISFQVVVMTVLTVVLLNPVPAGAAFLNYVENQNDGFGMGGAQAAVASNDGKHIYVASRDDDAVMVFSRNATTGALTHVETKVDGVDGVDGLNYASGIAISPDDAHVYVTGFADDAVAVFSRNTSTGELSFLERQKDGFGGITGLDGPGEIAVGPNGDYVYVLGMHDNSLVVFERNLTNGRLVFQSDTLALMTNTFCEDILLRFSEGPRNLAVTPGGKVLVGFFDCNRDKSTYGINIFGQFMPSISGGLVARLDEQFILKGNEASDIAISPNGQWVYVASSGTHSILCYEYDPSPDLPKESHLSLIKEQTIPTLGLQNVISLSVSPNDGRLFAAGTGEDTVTSFQINTTDGSIDDIKVLQNGVGSVEGLTNVNYVLTTSDNRHVYATSPTDDAMVALDSGIPTGSSFSYIAGFGNAGGIEGLNGANAVAVSPDGKHVYATAENDNALVLLSRNRFTGAMTHLETYDASTITGLNGASAVTVSPDGNNVYMTGTTGNTLVVFSRDDGTGALTLLETHEDGLLGVDGLRLPVAVAVSPDGGHVYAAGAWDDAIAVFSRDAVDGKLTFIEHHVDGLSGVDGLDYSSSVTVSPDNLNVYATGRVDNAVAVFSRDTTTGALTFSQVLKDGAGGVDGLDGAESVTLSPDGFHVYVAGDDDNALAVFSRDPGTGNLTFVEVEKDGQTGVDGLSSVSHVAVSPDGRFVYAAGRGDNSVAVFSRDAGTGELAFVEIRDDGVGGVDGLGGVNAVAVAPDNGHVYTAAVTDDAVAVFDTAPTITGIGTGLADDTYGIGEAIDITLTFSEDVALSGGSLTAGLNSGAAISIPAFAADNIATGTYTISEGESASDLDVTSLSLTAGAVLEDGTGNNAILTVPTGASLADNHQIAVDGAAPSLQSVTSATADGAYRAGNAIDVTLTFDEPVTLSGGNLTVTLDTGATVAIAPFGPSVTASGTYTVAAGEASTDLDSVSVALAAGAALTDAGGNDAGLTIPDGQSLADAGALIVDTAAPRITSIASSTADGLYGPGSAIAITVSFSEPVTLAGGTLDLTLNAGTQVSIPAFGPSDSVEIFYTVAAGENSADLDVTAVALNGGTVVDAAGNGASVALPATTIADGSNIVVDTTPPGAPVLSGATPTNDTTPVWTWTAGGDGIGVFRYKLDASDLSTGASITADTFYMPIGTLTGTHTLYVQERDGAGNWSASGNFQILVDITAPSAPVVTGPSRTNDTTPTWTWTAGTGGNGTFRFKLDDGNLSSGAVETPDLQYTPAAALSQGSHWLYVQERDDAGNWSPSAGFEVIVDTDVPGAPVVSGATPTNDATPTWSWVSGGGGIGMYRYKVDVTDLTTGATETTSTTHTPPTALTDGAHTLYVQERDEAGNWSASGRFVITVDTALPDAPVVAGDSPTPDTTPTWTWTSGGGGIGTYRYSLDGQPEVETPSTGFTPASVLSEGPHTLSVRELDAADNWSAVGEKTIEVDSGLPCSTASTPQAVDDATATFTVTYTAGDIYAGETCGSGTGSGLDRVELWVKTPSAAGYEPALTDTGAGIDGAFSYTVDTDQQGGYAFYTRAVDRAGNAETQSAPDAETVYASAFSGYAILSVGSISGQEGLASHTLTANTVYKHLINRNFGLMGDPADPLDHIKYYNPYDEPQTGEDEYTGGYWLAMQQAVTGWALDRMRVLPGPLYLIFIDHGSPDTLYLTGTEHLLPQELDDWLSTLESGMAAAGIDEDIVVILGTCFSGSFIDALSGPGRIIVTSTPADEPSYRGPRDPGGVRDGEFFITALFNGLGRGLNLAESFEGAVDLTEAFTDSGYPETPAPYFDTARQHPMLDDNGDGVGSNHLASGDGSAAGWMYLGHGIGAPDPVTVTGAGAVPDAPLTTAAEALLWAEVSDPSRADSVWVEIREPGLTLEGGDVQQTVELVERPMALNAGTNRYEVSYYNFTTPGTYTLYFYVRDTGGLISPFQRAFVHKSLAGNAAPDPFHLTLPADGAEVAATFVLDWDDASDPDGDPITYTVRIAAGDDPDFADPVVEIEGLERSLCRIDQAEYGLADTTDYLWQVLAVDEYGARTPNHPPVAGQPHGTFSTNFQNPVPAWFEGQIYNSATGLPVSDVSVEIGGDATSTDAGGYVLDETTPGTYSLTVTADGYDPVTQEVDLPAGDLTSRSIGLDPAQAPAPAFSPAPGTYATFQDVTLSCPTAGAAIRYTTDGSDPTETSPRYTDPIPLTATTTIKARAFADGLGASIVMTGVFTIEGTVAAPTFAPAGGTFVEPVSVILSCATPDTTIRYTTDGSDPTEASPAYSAPIAVSETTTLRARAYSPQSPPSEVAEAAFTIRIVEELPAPSFSPEPGTYVTAQTVSMTCGISDAEIRYTMDGSEPTAGSALYTGPVPLSATATVKARAFKTGWEPSATETALYTITGTVAAPVFSIDPGTYRSAQEVNLTCPTDGAAIHYTTDGSDPTADSPILSAPISVSTTTVIKAMARMTGWAASETITGQYTIVGTVAPPAFSPEPGTFTAAQQVAITCATAGAVIRYTLDGAEPTGTSQIYVDPIPITRPTTVKARAFLVDSLPSTVVSGHFAIIQSGDVNGDGDVDLGDAVLALQIAAGVTPAAAVYAEADVDGDGKIGMGEALFAFQTVAGFR